VEEGDAVAPIQVDQDLFPLKDLFGVCMSLLLFFGVIFGGELFWCQWFGDFLSPSSHGRGGRAVGI
jgi:hypothetical protein